MLKKHTYIVFTALFVCFCFHFYFHSFLLLGHKETESVIEMVDVNRNKQTLNYMLIFKLSHKKRIKKKRKRSLQTMQVLLTVRVRVRLCVLVHAHACMHALAQLHAECVYSCVA